MVTTPSGHSKLSTELKRSTIQTARFAVERLRLRRDNPKINLGSGATVVERGTSCGELTLQFNWWRAIYHFARPAKRASLRQIISEHSSWPRYQSRTPAQAAGLTDRPWTVLEARSVSYSALPFPTG
jgi:hypothetical protein